MRKTTLSLCASFFLALLTTPGQAGESSVAHDNLPRIPATPTEDDGDAHNLEQRMTPEERQELYQNLQSQSEAAYSDHALIESRRKIMRERMSERLQHADTDNDNSVSRIEAEESMPGLAKYFDQIDFNHDGVITLDEMKAEDDRRRELREQKKMRQLQKKLQEAAAEKKQIKKAKSRKRPRKPNPPEMQQPAEVSS
jgi:hypothetical protein